MRKKPLKGVADLSTAQLSKIFIKNLDKLYADPQVSKYFTVTAQKFNDLIFPCTCNAHAASACKGTFPLSK